MRKLSDIRKAKAAQASVPVAPASDATALQVATSNLPSLDAPVLNTAEPSRSYKINQKASRNFIVSEDGGATNTDSGSNAVGGHPADLSLVIAPAKRPTGSYTHDYRLRLAFFDGDGVLSELNLNALTVRDGVPSVSTASRCLIAALSVITDSEDDMHAFIDGVRFSLEAGSSATFINVAVSNGDQWCQIDNRAAFKQVPQDPATFIALIAQIKTRLRSAGYLAATPAVIGSSPLLEERAAITVTATTA